MHLFFWFSKLKTINSTQEYNNPQTSVSFFVVSAYYYVMSSVKKTTKAESSLNEV